MISLNNSDYTDTGYVIDTTAGVSHWTVECKVKSNLLSVYCSAPQDGLILLIDSTDVKFTGPV